MRSKRTFIAVLAAVLVAAAGAAVIIFAYTHDNVTVSFVGDILLARGVAEVIEEHSARYLFDGVRAKFNASDIVFGNLECALTEGGVPAVKSETLLFKADPGCAEALREAGFSVLNLANNHSMDYGGEGISNTIEELEACGIRALGAGGDKEDANKPVYIEKGGVTFGFLGFSDFPADGYFTFGDRPDVVFVDRQTIAGRIGSAKKECDILIVSFHWGVEFSQDFDSLQQELAHMAADSGADIIVGHHPHVLQGIEKYKRSYIFYSLGNFVFDSLAPPGTDETLICDIEFSGNTIKKIALTPVKIIDCRPEKASGDTAERLLERLAELSADYDVDIEERNGTGYIEP